MCLYSVSHQKGSPLELSAGAAFSSLNALTVLSAQEYSNLKLFFIICSNNYKRKCLIGIEEVENSPWYKSFQWLL